MSASPRRTVSRDLVGRGFASLRAETPLARLRARPLGWLIAVCLSCALAVVALRIDILRVRYALAEAIREEKALLQQQGQHAVQLETLRNPARLSALARARGFGRPERILDLRSEDLRSEDLRSEDLRSEELRPDPAGEPAR